ncbi:MAG: NADH-quinone oxidoreductase subunit M [candidate division Zixibacteria bacterium]|nr:NADH-quinone oxidoreductase subunit M [candidate division Zixibacteria bacterium]
MTYSYPILTYTIFLPLIGAVLLLFIDKEKHNAIRWTSAFFSFITLIMTLVILKDFDWTTAQMQFMETHSWIPAIGSNYILGVDGISVPMLVLTSLISLIAIVISFNITKRVKEYFVFFLLLECGMIGVFAALDFFLFYVFWEIMLVPMYFLIGIWGGPQREYAAIKFFLYTLFGSIFMLVAILILYFTSEPHTLSMMELIQIGPSFSHNIQIMAFAFFFIAFAIKVPVWPFHTWLPDAHVQAPTAISIILAAVLLKMGTYGMLRISWPMLPEGIQYFSVPIAILGVIAIIYGALVSLAQKDLKKLVAYSSVSHMGYCMLALAAYTSVTAMAGCMFQMISHGLITGALFLLVGVLYDRAHTREIAAFGGIGKKLPVYTALMVMFGMASLGLPGMSGFISEFMVFVGSFDHFWAEYWYIVALAILGVVLTAAYILRMIQNVFLGEFDEERWGHLTDINIRETLCVAPLAVLTIIFGIYPDPVIKLMEASLNNLVTLMAR